MCCKFFEGLKKHSKNSRGGEHKPGTNNNKESAIKDHAETTDHDIDTSYVEILEKNVNNWLQVRLRPNTTVKFSTQEKNSDQGGIPPWSEFFSVLVWAQFQY